MLDAGGFKTRFQPRVIKSAVAGGAKLLNQKGKDLLLFSFLRGGVQTNDRHRPAAHANRLAQVGAELDAIGADAAEGTVRKILTGLGFTDEMQVGARFFCVVVWMWWKIEALSRGDVSSRNSCPALVHNSQQLGVLVVLYHDFTPKPPAQVNWKYYCTKSRRDRRFERLDFPQLKKHIKTIEHVDEP